MSRSSTSSTTSSLEELVRGKPISEKPWYMTWNQGQLLVWKGGKRLQTQVGNKSISAGPVLEMECINDRAIQIIGDCKDKGGIWRVRLSLDKLETKANKFMQSIASAGVHGSHEFCKEIHRVTQGHVKYTTDNTDNHQGDNQEDSQDVYAVEETQMNESKQDLGIDQEISLAYIGTYSVSLDQLHSPSPLLRVREVKEWFVEYLAEELKKENNDHEEMTAPLVVIAKVTKEEFRTRDLSSYTFEVIGGVHRYLALLKISKKNAFTRKCAIYGAELSRNAILRLGNQQNEVNQIQRATTLSEVAATCRRLLFAHFANGNLKDDGEYMPNIPRYNTQKYREWKTECVSYLSSPTTSSAYIDTALQMALQSPKVYHLLQKVFALYEEGKLKGQQQHKLKGGTLQKALQGKFSARLNHFKVFQGLKDADKIDILNQLLALEITWNEATEEIKNLKQLQPIKEAFLATMKLKDWKDAQMKYEYHTNTTRLQQFVGRDFKDVPKDFMDYCNEAKLFTTKSKSSKKPTELMHQGQRVNLLECSITEISDISIERNEFELVTIAVQPKWNEIEIANVVSRIGEINTSEAYYIAIFDVDKSNCQVVKNKLEESSLMCKIVTLVMPENQNGRGTAVTATALLAYFGKNEPAEYIEDHTTDAFVCKTEVDWMQFLFGLISKTSTVLMIYDTEGKMVMATTKYGHDVFCICYKENFEGIVSLLNSNDNTQIQEHEGDTDKSNKRKRSRYDGDSGNKKKK